MTEPITDAEITALFSADHKLAARALKLIYEAIAAIGGVQDLGALITAVEAVTTELTTLETDIEATVVSVDAVTTKLGTIETDIEAIMGALSLIKQSTAGGTQKLTISSNVAQGSSQACRSVLVVHSSDNAVYLQLGATADADDFIVPKNVPIPIPIDNCSKLYFYGTDADTIRLLWRN